MLNKFLAVLCLIAPPAFAEETNPLETIRVTGVAVSGHIGVAAGGTECRIEVTKDGFLVFHWCDFHDVKFFTPDPH